MTRPPLELTIFEKHPRTEGAGGPVYRVGGSFTPYAIVATEKRFTDAELAAEYWSAAEEATSRYFRAMDADEAQRIEGAILRFATLPHYDEEPS
jgi:hypothetical protein